MSSSLLGYLSSSESILLLAFGFGFVIFWHELGHFLAAKWADVKVEQFAVGFGQAMVSWRKGLGFTWGSSNEPYQKRLKEYLLQQQADNLQLKDAILVEPTEAQLSEAAAALNISETEYRLNWIPLGGYVKMLGQDDLKPGQTVSDPRSYNNKTIAQRMVIVSAGVVMNVILAAIGFMYIFTVGFEVTKPVAGLVIPGSPAQNTYRLVNGQKVPTPLQVGDQILSLNGRLQSDFDKIKLNTALLIAGETVPLTVRHTDGQIQQLFVTPDKSPTGSDFPAIGMGASPSLKGPPADAQETASEAKESKETSLIKKGDVITAVDGQPVKPDQYYLLDAALQKAAGKPVPVTVTDSNGHTRTEYFKPDFVERFKGEADPINFAGMQMLARIETIQNNSPLIKQGVEPGDVIVSIAEPGASGQTLSYPTGSRVVEEFHAAGDKQVPLTITLRRNGKELPPITATPNVKIGPGKYGFGIALGMDEQEPIVAKELLDGSPAKAANVPGGTIILAVNGTPVSNWFDIRNAMKELKADQPVVLSTEVEGKKSSISLKPLSGDELAEIRTNTLISMSCDTLMPDEFARKGKNPWEAAQMGVGETRDAILQVYQTVRSMSRGSISVKEVSGPVGILTAGYIVAERGITHLIWFLSIISANLAVMNFLPIPIVDGGLFTFLVIEKIKGSPISQRTQAIAQVVGLALLLSVFLFATYQDVFTRLPILFR
jgi:regulator of sigma E protease